MKKILAAVICGVLLSCNTTPNASDTPSSGGVYLTTQAEWNQAAGRLGDRDAGPAGGSWFGGDRNGSGTLSASLENSFRNLYAGLAGNASIRNAVADPEPLLPAVIEDATKVYAAKESGRVKTIVEVTRSADQIAAHLRALVKLIGAGAGGTVSYDRLRIGLIDTAPRSSQGRFKDGRRRPRVDDFRKALEDALGTKVETVPASATDRKDVQRLREYLYETMGQNAVLKAAITRVEVNTPEIEGGKHLRLKRMVIHGIELPSYPDPRRDLEFDGGDWKETTDVGVGVRYIVEEGAARAESTAAGFVVTKGETPLGITLELVSRNIGDEGDPGTPITRDIQLTQTDQGAYYGDTSIGRGALTVTVQWELDGEYIYLFEARDFSGNLPAAMAAFERSVWREEEGDRPLTFFLRDPGSNLVAKVYGFAGGDPGASVTADFPHYTDLKVVSARYVTVSPEERTSGSFADVNELLAAKGGTGGSYDLTRDEKERILTALEALSPKPLPRVGGRYQVQVRKTTLVFGWFEHSNGTHTVYVIDTQKGVTGRRVMNEFKR